MPVKTDLTSAAMVLAGLFAKVDSNFQLVTRSSLTANTAGATISLISFSLMTYSAFQSRSGFRGLFFTKSALQYTFQTRWLIFFVLQKQYEFYLKLIHFCTTSDPQANSSLTRKQRELQQLH